METGEGTKAQLLQLAGDPGIVHMILVSQACMSYEVIETATQISEKVRDAQTV